MHHTLLWNHNESHTHIYIYIHISYAYVQMLSSDVELRTQQKIRWNMGGSRMIYWNVTDVPTRTADSTSDP